ncbi:hypothetical protein [Geothermobacter hydrogeniphilus]|uniref:Uncharacterized protein n=1 Tax=Geothermobacter hydrogeniphilus TaxID=1969733 RepID=A0A1X0Y578_9BACT|nr:hypothetical protein [Geothermobacter hydrogeniphilus]ORJ60315.1 hypothetical protein B5V00_08675 [Geothermobacter hydrogeniphilus]
MAILISYTQIRLDDILPPPAEYLDKLDLSSIRYQLPSVTTDGHLLSPEAAILLAHSHPIFTWKKMAIAGLRTYCACCNNSLEYTKIQVGVLPTKTSLEDVISFARQIEILNLVQGSVASPIPSAFSLVKRFNLENLIPLFGKSQRTISRRLKIAERTLQKHRQKT